MQVIDVNSSVSIGLVIGLFGLIFAGIIYWVKLLHGWNEKDIFDNRKIISDHINSCNERYVIESSMLATIKANTEACQSGIDSISERINIITQINNIAHKELHDRINKLISGKTP